MNLIHILLALLSLCSIITGQVSNIPPAPSPYAVYDTFCITHTENIPFFRDSHAYKGFPIKHDELALDPEYTTYNLHPEEVYWAFPCHDKHFHGCRFDRFNNTIDIMQHDNANHMFDNTICIQERFVVCMKSDGFFNYQLTYLAYCGYATNHPYSYQPQRVAHLPPSFEDLSVPTNPDNMALHLKGRVVFPVDPVRKQRSLKPFTMPFNLTRDYIANLDYYVLVGSDINNQPDITPNSHAPIFYFIFSPYITFNSTVFNQTIPFVFSPTFNVPIPEGLSDTKQIVLHARYRTIVFPTCGSTYVLFIRKLPIFPYWQRKTPRTTDADGASVSQGHSPNTNLQNGELNDMIVIDGVHPEDDEQAIAGYAHNDPNRQRIGTRVPISDAKSLYLYPSFCSQYATLKHGTSSCFNYKVNATELFCADTLHNYAFIRANLQRSQTSLPEGYEQVRAFSYKPVDPRHCQIALHDNDQLISNNLLFDHGTGLWEIQSVTYSQPHLDRCFKAMDQVMMNFYDNTVYCHFISENKYLPAIPPFTLSHQLHFQQRPPCFGVYRVQTLSLNDHDIILESNPNEPIYPKYFYGARYKNILLGSEIPSLNDPPVSNIPPNSPYARVFRDNTKLLNSMFVTLHKNKGEEPYLNYLQRNGFYHKDSSDALVRLQIKEWIDPASRIWETGVDMNDPFQIIPLSPRDHQHTMPSVVSSTIGNSLNVTLDELRKVLQDDLISAPVDHDGTISNRADATYNPFASTSSYHVTIRDNRPHGEFSQSVDDEVTLKVIQFESPVQASSIYAPLTQFLPCKLPTDYCVTFPNHVQRHYHPLSDTKQRPKPTDIITKESVVKGRYRYVPHLNKVYFAVAPFEYVELMVFLCLPYTQQPYLNSRLAQDTLSRVDPSETFLLNVYFTRDGTMTLPDLIGTVKIPQRREYPPRPPTVPIGSPSHLSETIYHFANFWVNVTVGFFIPATEHYGISLYRFQTVYPKGLRHYFRGQINHREMFVPQQYYFDERAYVTPWCKSIFNRCLNGGRCNERHNGCFCRQPFSGVFCQVNVCEVKCVNNPALNNIHSCVYNHILDEDYNKMRLGPDGMFLNVIAIDHEDYQMDAILCRCRRARFNLAQVLLDNINKTPHLAAYRAQLIHLLGLNHVGLANRYSHIRRRRQSTVGTQTYTSSYDVLGEAERFNPEGIRQTLRKPHIQTQSHLDNDSPLYEHDASDQPTYPHNDHTFDRFVAFHNFSFPLPFSKSPQFQVYFGPQCEFSTLCVDDIPSEYFQDDLPIEDLSYTSNIPPYVHRRLVDWLTWASQQLPELLPHRPSHSLGEHEEEDTDLGHDPVIASDVPRAGIEGGTMRSGAATTSRFFSLGVSDTGVHHNETQPPVMHRQQHAVHSLLSPLAAQMATRRQMKFVNSTYPQCSNRGFPFYQPAKDGERYCNYDRCKCNSFFYTPLGSNVQCKQCTYEILCSPWSVDRCTDNPKNHLCECVRGFSGPSCHCKVLYASINLALNYNFDFSSVAVQNIFDNQMTFHSISILPQHQHLNDVVTDVSTLAWIRKTLIPALATDLNLPNYHLYFEQAILSQGETMMKIIVALRTRTCVDYLMDLIPAPRFSPIKPSSRDINYDRLFSIYKWPSRQDSSAMQAPNTRPFNHHNFIDAQTYGINVTMPDFVMKLPPPVTTALLSNGVIYRRQYPSPLQAPNAPGRYFSIQDYEKYRDHLGPDTYSDFDTLELSLAWTNFTARFRVGAAINTNQALSMLIKPLVLRRDTNTLHPLSAISPLLYLDDIVQDIVHVDESLHDAECHHLLGPNSHQCVGNGTDPFDAALLQKSIRQRPHRRHSLVLEMIIIILAVLFAITLILVLIYFYRRRLFCCAAFRRTTPSRRRKRVHENKTMKPNQRLRPVEQQRGADQVLPSVHDDEPSPTRNEYPHGHALVDPIEVPSPLSKPFSTSQGMSGDTFLQPHDKHSRIDEHGRRKSDDSSSLIYRSSQKLRSSSSSSLHRASRASKQRRSLNSVDEPSL